jgi:hypothetical protein
MNKETIKMNSIFGKDWDKYIICEGCGHKPTLCICKRQIIIDILIVSALIIIGFIIGYVWIKIN